MDWVLALHTGRLSRPRLGTSCAQLLAIFDGARSSVCSTQLLARQELPERNLLRQKLRSCAPARKLRWDPCELRPSRETRAPTPTAIPSPPAAPAGSAAGRQLSQLVKEHPARSSRQLYRCALPPDYSRSRRKR